MTDTPLEGGSYDVLRRRLRTTVRDLDEHVGALDARRSAVFGSRPMTLVGSDRIVTPVACRASDLVRVGELVLLGYTVELDLAAITPEHVFALYTVERDGGDGVPQLHPLPADDERNFLADPSFRDAFATLHRYYGKARFTDLRLARGQLLAVFQVGERIDDVQVLRWTVPADGRPQFVDARGDRDYTWPDAHDVTWIPATREDQRAGAHPSVSVLDEVFVGLRDGKLELRVDDGSRAGRSILTESIGTPNQSLADVTVAHAVVGDVLLLQVGLYEEPPRGYLIGRRTRTARRVDAVVDAIRQLPGGDGVVFPGGYHLGTTGTRLFEVDAADMIFEESIAAPGGEDMLFVFHRRHDGEYLLAPYRLVDREIPQVVPCHGFAALDDGAIVLFRAAPHDAAPSEVHPVQWWASPFSDVAPAPDAGADPWVARLGNPDLVRGLADVRDLLRLADDADPTERTWTALIAAARSTLDTHLWLADDEVGPLRDGLRSVVDTAGQLVDETEARRRRQAAAIERVEEARRSVLRVVDAGRAAATPDELITAIGALRTTRGETALVADVAEVDTDAVAVELATLDEALAEVAERATEVLDSDTAFAALTTRLSSLATEGEAAPTVADLDEVAERVGEAVADLDAVVDTVSSLDGGDATARTRIVRRVADVIAEANRTRARLDGRRRTLASEESTAAFDAEVALIEQSLSGAAAAVATPDAADDEMARLIVNVERLEARFGDDPDRLPTIVELRDSVSTVLGGRRAELVEQRAARARRITAAAERLLETVTRRAADAGDAAEVETFFATDQMAARVRQLAAELDELGEAGPAAELRSALVSAAEEASRRVRDREELVADDGSLALGNARFAPNAQPFELVLVGDDDGRAMVTLTGTDLRVDVTDRLGEYADLLSRPYPSESAAVSRAEFLAWAVVADAADLTELASDAAVPERIAERCRRVAEHRHGEGYELGVHDHDAARILAAALPRGATDPVLRFPARARALARLVVGSVPAGDDRTALIHDVIAARTVAELGSRQAIDRMVSRVSAAAADALAELPDLRPTDADDAAAVIVDDLCRHANGTRLGPELTAPATIDALMARRRELPEPAAERLARAGGATIVDRYVREREIFSALAQGEHAPPGAVHDIDEAAAVAAAGDVSFDSVTHPGTVVVDGLVSRHQRIDGGTLEVRLDELATRAGPMLDAAENRWPAYRAARQSVVDEVRAEVMLDEHRPRVMAGFVRNRLLDRVLLPLVGDNLANQIGAVSSEGRARSGLLVLTSPPGYGKTTLMSWVADRLGMLMVKVNGPALGPGTTSLDPAEAPDAAARAEVEKMNLALRMGTNVVLFVDDIQFTSPALLSRFIPLADATRRIEGVVDGEPVTFDLRRSRFAVVMAGNPYSTGGARFELPDMLVNRADVHNLGDVADGNADEFALSYLENSLTANEALASRSSAILDDLEPLMAMADGRRAVGTEELNHRWDPSELDGAVRTLGHLRRAQKVLMAVNGEYVSSAATADDDRVAPPFLLQGSYRNMARVAGRIVPAMTDDEVDAVVDDHYRAEAQTLTDRAEQNLLALAVLTGTATAEETERWASICARWSAREGDAADAVVAAMDRMADALDRAIDLPPPDRS